jgi:SAM-dependent methyltransferase
MDPGECGMTIDKCRVCGQDFFSVRLLEYKNMPAVAQHLPNLETLESDKGIDLEICQCSGCGLVQLTNDPVPYYREVIRASAFSEEMKGFRMEQFETFVETYSLKGKKIIEIGCGCGEYLSIMQQFCVETYGLEQSEKSVQQCVQNGLKVSRGFIESGDRLKEAPFDAFFILNFLEHLPAPNSVLRGIYANLTDGAIGLVEVPNFDMILQKRLFSEFTRDHLFYFTKDTLETLLRLNGYEVVECNVIWHEYIISAVIRKRKRLDVGQFHEHQKRLKTEIEEYIAQFERVAIWGAGHQALAIIALVNLTDRVKYIVDSATFKQGKYTPATHIPIVAPAALDDNPVQAIIVMAASYSDEIVRGIKQRYGSKISIAILREYGLEIA